MWNRIKPINNGLNIKPEMPKDREEVLIWIKGNDSALLAEFKDGKFNYYEHDFVSWRPFLNVTHWQPLPSEPFNHIEGECTTKECVNYCPSLEKE